MMYINDTLLETNKQIKKTKTTGVERFFTYFLILKTLKKKKVLRLTFNTNLKCFSFYFHKELLQLQEIINNFL